MKLLETYSRNASAPISHNIDVIEKYFPLPVDKYITLQANSGMPAKDYDWFQEVIDLLSPTLDENGIKIIRIGRDESQPFLKVVDLRNLTNLGQSCYLIKRSMCHLSVDSWSCHYAASQEVPLVALYGSTSVANHSPYHINKDKATLLESHRGGKKPSFSREESPKTVNFINPEDVAKSVMGHLGLKFHYPYKTVELGNEYQHRIIEVVPNAVVNPAQLNTDVLIVRMDYLFNEYNLMGQLTQCKCHIITDRPIKTEILQRYKQNVLGITYNIKNDPAPEASFVKELFDNKIRYQLISFLSDEEVNKYKLDFMPWGIIELKKSIPPEEFKNDKLIDLSNYFYKSNRFLVARGRVYQSFYDYKNGRPISALEPVPQQIIGSNLSDLWLNKDSNYILKKSS